MIPRAHDLLINLPNSSKEGSELRRGPWTSEEDNLLSQYIARHGEGRWNLVAKCAGLKRTGKSCRLRWVNYLKPDIKRGNLTPQEQQLIIQLHRLWGNRWSKIARHLPGRTDNEIKNHWRTRVQKKSRQHNFESDSRKFLEAVHLSWMPRQLPKNEHSLQKTTSHTTLHSQNHSAPKARINSTPINSLDSPPEEPKLPINLYHSKPEILEYSLHHVDACHNPNSEHNFYLNSPGFDVDSLAPKKETGDCDMSAMECQVDESHWATYGVANTLWSVDDAWYGEL